ncbi:MAG: DoxX family protein [Spirosomaceae bacterium]|nr:DoxX family protein [Spirosomataceae bacterium]
MLTSLLAPKKLNGSVNLGVLILRVFLGILMLTHGYPKFEKMLSGDMSFGNPIFLGEELSFILTVFAEFVCSILLIFGLLTRPAVFFLAFTMAVAAFIVHVDDGIAKQEKALLYLAGYVCLWFTGPGKYSADERLF